MNNLTDNNEQDLPEMESLVIPEGMEEFYENNKAAVQVVHMMNVFAKATQDAILNTILQEQPRNAIAIALAALEDANNLYAAIQQTMTSESLTVPKETILVAVIACMSLVAIDAETRMLDDFTHIMNAMSEATNMREPEETLH